MRVLKQGKAIPNGFFFLPIHYTHDPAKTSYEWREKMRAAFPKPTDFDKEMEIDFQLHIGAPAYPRFNDVKHLASNLPYDDRRPLCLAFDFNTNPMSLMIMQVYLERRLLYVLKEFVYGPTTIDYVVNDFRNTYPSHRSDILVYGDATKGTTAQTAMSNWDVVRLCFRGYHVQPQFRLPGANPRIGDRLNAVNRLFQGDGPVRIVIDRDECPEFVRDLREVIMTPDGKQIFKESDPDNPYYFRTHPSDAFGYYAYREFPTVSEVVSMISQPRAPIVAGRLLGEVDQGLKAEQKKEVEFKKQRRQPLDRSKAR